jgi:murein DD-endopeptidase MepM/ murein hydrolase activator NlpD
MRTAIIGGGPGGLYLSILLKKARPDAEVHVVERNGLYLPYEIDLMIGDEEDDVYLPIDFLQHALEVDPDIHEEQDKVVFTIDDEAEEVFSAIEEEGVSLEDLDVEDLIEYLSFLSNPIPGAQISTQASHLPGAPREYRNGYHEGIDWYSGTSGREIDLNTEVLSVADGVVVRVDSDYEEYDIEEREWELQISAQKDDTPEYILDNLRGRSVWVQYDAGVMIRYAHLSDIAPELEVGDGIQRGDPVGYVGNSGTSFAVEGDETGGLHLHADLLIYGELFWTYIHNEEDVREVLEHTFSDDPQD